MPSTVLSIEEVHLDIRFWFGKCFCLLQFAVQYGNFISARLRGEQLGTYQTVKTGVSLWKDLVGKKSQQPQEICEVFSSDYFFALQEVEAFVHKREV